MVDCGAGAVVAAGGKDAGLSGDALKTSRLPQLRTISRILVVGMWKLWIELERGVGEEKLETRLGGGSRAVEAMEKEQDGRTAVRESEGARSVVVCVGKRPHGPPAVNTRAANRHLASQKESGNYWTSLPRSPASRVPLPEPAPRQPCRRCHEPPDAGSERTRGLPAAGVPR